MAMLEPRLWQQRRPVKSIDELARVQGKEQARQRRKAGSRHRQGKWATASTAATR
jgi:hypothetical protein